MLLMCYNMYVCTYNVMFLIWFIHTDNVCTAYTRVVTAFPSQAEELEKIQKRTEIQSDIHRPFMQMVRIC